MFENKLSGLWPYCLKNKESDRRATKASNIPEVQLKKNCLPSLWSGDIWSTKNPCVFGDGVCTGSSCLFLCNLHSQGSPTVVLVPAWQKLEGYVKDVLAEQMGTPLFFAIPTGQKMLSEDRKRRIIHTPAAFYFPPVFMDVSRPRYPFVILIPLFFCLFLSSFGYKPASRQKQLSSRAAS